MAQGTSDKSAGLNGRLALGLLVGLVLGIVVGNVSPRLGRGPEDQANDSSEVGVEDKRAEREIRQLYDREHELLLRRDFVE